MALEERGVYDRDVSLGVLGTIAIETASTFQPIHEYGTAADWANYGGGQMYAGRGFVQLTHLANYRSAGEALGIDLADNPDLALDPDIAAAVLAWFWATKGVQAKDGSRWWSLPDLCRAHDWEWTRRVVQGGTAGLGRLTTIATALDAIREPIPMPPARVTFDPAYPAVLQDDSASCAPSSLTWAMRALGRMPADNWIEQDMQQHGLWNPSVGLTDHTGAGIVAWLAIDDATHYGSDGYGASNNTCPVSWDALVPEIDPHPPYPILLGLPNWSGGIGHWVGVRGFSGGKIQLANPATGVAFGQTELTRNQFEARANGNASIVRVLHPDLLTPAAPEPPKLPPKLTVEEVLSELKRIVGRPDEEIVGRVLRADLAALIERLR